MRDGDTETQQPNRQRRELMQEAAAPRRTVVHQHSLGQTVPPKNSRQLVLDGRGPFIPTCLKTKGVTRMIIQHGERMTALMIAQKKMPLKIHLPELVRSLVFESSIRTYRLFRRMAYAVMTQQDRVHGAFSQRFIANSLQTRLDLTCSPTVLIPNCQHLFFDRRLTASRRMLRSARKIGQACGSLFSISLSSFVTGLAADAESTAQLAEVDSPILSQGQKLLSQTHGRTLLPRHDPLLKRSSCYCAMCYPCLRTPVTYVSDMYTPNGGGNLTRILLWFTIRLPLIVAYILNVNLTASLKSL